MFIKYFSSTVLNFLFLTVSLFGLSISSAFAAVGFCPTDGTLLTLVQSSNNSSYRSTGGTGTGVINLGDVEFGQFIQLTDFEADPVAFFSPDSYIVDTEFRYRIYPENSTPPSYTRINLAQVASSGTVCQQSGSSKWLLFNSPITLNDPNNPGVYQVDTQFYTRGNGGGAVTVQRNTYKFNQLALQALDYSSSTQAVQVDLVSNTLVRGSVTDNIPSGVRDVIGSDVVHAEDILRGDEQDNILQGMGGNDLLEGRTGTDYLVGGGGYDTADYSTATSGIVVNLTTAGWLYDGTNSISNNSAQDGLGDIDTLESIEQIYGSNYDDYINGTNGEIGYIEGRNGNDVILGGDHDDTINGGEGNDTITALGGNDVVLAGSGSDIISGSGGDDLLFGGEGNDLLRGNDGNDELWGDAGNDELRGFTGNDILHGGDGDDVLYGGQTASDTYASDDELYGNAGGDILWGLAGDDLLDGGAGNDTLLGGDGNDRLLTSDGRDVLRGGLGSDTIEFTAYTDSADIIKGFSLQEGDQLDISHLIDGYNPATDSVTDYIEIRDSGVHSIILVDRDGSGIGASFVWMATMQNITGLTDETALVSSGHLILLQ